MAAFFEEPENKTLMSQMLSGQKLPYEAAAGQWADALGFMAPGGGFLQEISRRDAMRGLVKGLAKEKVIKGPYKSLEEIRATKSILRDISRTPQKELDRIDEVTAKWPDIEGDIAVATYGKRLVPIKSPSGSISGSKTVPHTRIEFNPGEIETAATNDWAARGREPDVLYARRTAGTDARLDTDAWRGYERIGTGFHKCVCGMG